jgi:hypothetical protein
MRNGNFFQALRTLYQWKNGVVVKDWRYAVRICNINVTDLTGQTGTQAATAATQIINLMSARAGPHPEAGHVQAGVLCQPHRLLDAANRCAEQEQRCCRSKKALNSVRHAVSSKPASWAYPAAQVDQLLNTEARVV